MKQYMKIFWTQNQNPNEPSTLIIDGAMDQYKGLPEQEEAMAKLNELKECGCDPAITEDRSEGKGRNSTHGSTWRSRQARVSSSDHASKLKMTPGI